MSEPRRDRSITQPTKSLPEIKFFCPVGCCILMLAKPFHPAHQHGTQELRCVICSRILVSQAELDIMWQAYQQGKPVILEDTEPSYSPKISIPNTVYRQ